MLSTKKESTLHPHVANYCFHKIRDSAYRIASYNHIYWNRGIMRANELSD